MSLALKITLTKPGSAGISKVIRFAPNVSVLEACKQAQEKHNEGGPDHGLFQPAVEGKRAARWLRNDRTLAYYDLQNNDELIYKKKHRPLKVKLPDETIKTFLIDETQSVSEIVAVIGEKMSISNAEEFSLMKDVVVDPKAKTEKGESKKMDDWLVSTQSIPEQGIADDAILLFRRKYTVTQNLSTEDPVALHLIYIESRDAIMKGNHPCSVEDATMFAALQMQVQLGSFDANKKYNVKDFLPSSLHKKAKTVEPNIMREYKKLVGMQDINAKYRYVQLCRSLKTWGITFFDVKRKQKTGKKTTPLLLGITREGLIFLDYETKEVMKEFPLTHLRRWAAAASSFTLDFGDHEDDYVVLLTDDAEAISQLLAGYIDILIKKKNESSVVLSDDGANVANEESVGLVKASAMMSTTLSTIGNFSNQGGSEQLMGPGGQGMAKSSMAISSQKAVPTNLGSAMTYISSLINEIQPNQAIPRNSSLTPEQWKKQLIGNSEQLMNSVARLAAILPPNSLDKGLLDSRAAEIANLLGTLVSAARNAASTRENEEDIDLLLGAKRVADAIKEMLDASRDLADKPTDPKAMERFQMAQKALLAANLYMQNASKGMVSDGPSQKLITESSKHILAALQDLLGTAQQRKDPKVLDLAEQANKAGLQLDLEVQNLVPSILNPGVQKQISDSAQGLETLLSYLRQAGRLDDDPNSPLALAAKGVSDAIKQLLSTTRVAEAKDNNPDFTSASQEIFNETAKIMAAEGDPEQINNSTKALVTATTKLVGAAKAAASTADEETKNRLLDCAKAVAEATRKLVGLANVAASNPNDKNAHIQLQNAAQLLVQATQDLVGREASKAAVVNLRTAAKIAAAATTGLVSTAKSSAATCSDPTTAQNLKTNSNQSAAAVAQMIEGLLKAWQRPDDPNAQEELLRLAREAGPVGYKLVAASKSAIPKITDPNNKSHLRQAADDAADALQKLISACQNYVVSMGAGELEEAFELFAAEEANLDAALFDVQSGNFMLDSSQSPEAVLSLLQQAAKEVSVATRKIVQGTPDQLGANARDVSASVTKANMAAKTLASTINDKNIQKEILEAAKGLTREARNTISCARASASNPSDQNLTNSLVESAKGVAEALGLLLGASKGAQSGAKECDDAIQLILNSANRLAPNQSANPKDFGTYSEDLETNVKAVQAAVNSVISSARSNPKMLAGAAKTTANTIPPLIQSASLAAGASPNPAVQKDILIKTKEATNQLSNTMNVAKIAAFKGDPNSLNDLKTAASSVNASLDALLSAVNSGNQGLKVLDEALKILSEAQNKMNEGWRVPQTQDVVTLVENLKKSTAKLGDSMKACLGSSRNEPEKVPVAMKEAATAIYQISEISKSLIDASQTSVYDEQIQKIQDQADIMAANSSNMGDQNAKQNTFQAAKDLTTAAQQLMEIVKYRTANNSNNNPNASLSNLNKVPLTQSQVQTLTNLVQKVFQQCGQMVLLAKDAVANKPGAAENLAGNQKSLANLLQQLKNEDPEKQASSKAKKLSLAVSSSNNSVVSMIDSARKVVKKPADQTNQTELSNGARNVGASIKSLLDSAKALSEIDLDEYIQKVAQAIADLDSAAISATVGLLENTAPSGKTAQELEEEMVQISRELANAIKDLVQAQREGPSALIKAAKEVGNLVPDLAEIAKASVSLTSDLEKQQSQLTLVKDIADNSASLLTACKQNDPKEIANQAKNSSQNISKLLSSLKGGVIALRDCDEASKLILEASKANLDTAPAYDSSKSYADSQRVLTNLARDLVAGIAKVISSAKTSPVEVGESAKKAAGVCAQLATTTRDALSSITEPKAQQGLNNGARNVLAATNKIVQTGKLVATDPKNLKNQQKLSSVHKEVTDAITEFVSAVKAGATGQLKAEASMDLILRNVAELDGAALHAATGELFPESDDMDIEELQQQVVGDCKAVAEVVKNLIQSADKTQTELGLAAAAGAEKFDKMCKDAKNSAALMNVLTNQQELLAATKAVGTGFHQLIQATLNHQKNIDDVKLKQDLAATSKKVSEALKEMAALSQNIGAAGIAGVRELEASRKGIAALLADFDKIPGNQNPTAVEVFKSAKGIADSVAVIVGSDDPQKVTKAAVDSLEAAKNLITSSKGAQRLTDPTNGKKLLEAVKNAADASVSFLESAKLFRKQPNPVQHQAMSEASEEVVKMIGAVVDAAKVLPGSEEALKLFQQQDELEQLAEKELLNAANAIEEATRTLMEAKRRQLEMRQNKESPLPEEEITEAILDACRAIAAATATLVAAATTAQKELVSKGKTTNQQNVYRRDPAWAKGLISAAQSVAGSVKDLVGAANSAAQGKAEEEALVAGARGVAAATARLVYASRAKADPFSPTQQQLSAAAKQVASATESLVTQAKNILTPEPETTPVWVDNAATQTDQKKAAFEAQMKILKLQKELEMAQANLANVRKAEYADANKSMVPGGVKQTTISPTNSANNNSVNNNNNMTSPKQTTPSKQTGPVKNVNPNPNPNPNNNNGNQNPNNNGTGRALPSPGGPGIKGTSPGPVKNMNPPTKGTLPFAGKK